MSIQRPDTVTNVVAGAAESAGTVLIMAGGTGGHIFPALSIARNLQERGYRAEWLGTARGLEVEVLRDTDIPLHCIDVKGLRGKGIVSMLAAPFMIAGGVLQAMKVLRSVHPCCVLGMGGYVTGPGGVAARLAGKPLLIHEQNAIAGFSNRMLAKIANRVMEAFPGTFPEQTKALCTGNPVRKEIVAVADSADRETVTGPLRLLVVGGSLGAVAINRLIPEVLAVMPMRERPQVWHQCGRNNVEATQQSYRNAGLELNNECRVEPFITDMAAAYGWADLVICRAGALTVSELAAAGLPSVLVPYPHAVDDHQTSNARWLCDAGAGVLVQQHDLDVQQLARQLREFGDNRQRLAAMSRAARMLAQPQASDLVTAQCMEACKAQRS